MTPELKAEIKALVLEVLGEVFAKAKTASDLGLEKVNARYRLMGEEVIALAQERDKSS